MLASTGASSTAFALATMPETPSSPSTASVRRAASPSSVVPRTRASIARPSATSALADAACRATIVRRPSMSIVCSLNWIRPILARPACSGDLRFSCMPVQNRTGALQRIVLEWIVIKTGEPDWNDLRYFLAAARAGTLSGAARALGVRHTTISRRLTALEGALGVSLVVRRPHGIEITPLGRKLLPLGDDLERAMQALTALVRSGKNRVRLALPSGFSSLFGQSMAAFHKTHANINLELTSGSRPVDLQRGEADLAVRV
ncbi:MAG: LysR family transcriptional regulator, partial [Mesorhizobium sp.]